MLMFLEKDKQSKKKEFVSANLFESCVAGTTGLAPRKLMKNK